MLYLVSGASRAGKTTIAKRILAEKQIPYLSLDWIMMGFTNGLPEYGIHDRLMPAEIAERIWPFIEAVFESMIWTETDHVIEGEALLPELVQKLISKHPNDVKICFVGFTDIDIDKKLADVKKYSNGDRDWLTKEDDAYIIDHLKNMVYHSEMIKKECSKHGLRYIDVSGNFLDSIQAASTYLLS